MNRIHILRISYLNGKWKFSADDYSPVFTPTTFVACKILPGIRIGLTFLTSYRTVGPDHTTANAFQAKTIAKLDEYFAEFAYGNLRDAIGDVLPGGIRRTLEFEDGLS